MTMRDGKGRFLKGHAVPLLYRLKVSKANKGCLPNKSSFKKGMKPWNLGISPSLHIRKSISEKLKGRKLKSDVKLKISKTVKMNNLGFKGIDWKNPGSLTKYVEIFDNNLKSKIKMRDKKCMLCKTTIKQLKLLNKRIHVHHIDFNKTNCNDKNLISLCNSCHSKTNFRSNYWITYFQKLTLKEA